MDEPRAVRVGQWMLLVAAALFVCSIAFLIAAARTARSQPEGPAVETRAFATVLQIMNGIVIPASTVVYDAVSTTVTIDGVEEVAPQNAEEWALVAANAASLAEAGNLLLLPAHAVDTEQWVAVTREFQDAAMLAVKAAEAQDKDAFLDAGSALNETCDTCHERYQRE